MHFYHRYFNGRHAIHDGHRGMGISTRIQEHPIKVAIGRLKQIDELALDIALVLFEARGIVIDRS